MNGLQRFAYVDADPDRFVYRKRTTLLSDGLEGLSLDELHPEPRTAVVLFRAVHGHDVRVTQPGEQAAFVENRRCRSEVARSNELECDLAIEAGIPRAIDAASRAVTDTFDQTERAPAVFGGSRSPDWEKVTGRRTGAPR